MHLSRTFPFSHSTITFLSLPTHWMAPACPQITSYTRIAVATRLKSFLHFLLAPPTHRAAPPAGWLGFFSYSSTSGNKVHRPLPSFPTSSSFVVLLTLYCGSSSSSYTSSSLCSSSSTFSSFIFIIIVATIIMQVSSSSYDYISFFFLFVFCYCDQRRSRREG